MNGKAFTALFRQRRKNHHAICLGLRSIAAGVAGRFQFTSADQHEDVEAAALLYAIERVEKFSLARGSDAFAYFSTMIFNAIRRQLGCDRRRHRTESRVLLFTDIEHNSGTDPRCRQGVAGYAFDISLCGRPVPYSRAAN